MGKEPGIQSNTDTVIVADLESDHGKHGETETIAEIWRMGYVENHRKGRFNRDHTGRVDRTEQI
jgi:hypothetical protein